MSYSNVRTFLKHKATQGALIATLCATVIALLAHSGALETLEYKTLDQRFRSMPAWLDENESPGDIDIIWIDQTSLEMVSKTIHQSWPWPREFYAKIIGYLKHAGARAVIFDMFFSEPDMDRPEILGADSDAALAAATAYAGNIIHSYVLQKDGLPSSPEKREAVQRFSIYQGTGNAPTLRNYSTGALPDPELTGSAAAIGFATQEPELDNISRRTSLLARFEDTIVMSQALSAAAWLRPDDPMHLTPDRFQIGNSGFATDKSANVYLHWYRPAADRSSPFRYHSGYNILRAAIRHEAGMDADLDQAAFKDRIVLIGSSAPGLFDDWATPLSKTTPGVLIQATALANLLRGESITRTGRMTLLPAILLAALLTAAATSVGHRYTLVVIAVPLLLLTVIIGGSYAALHTADLFVDMVPPSLAVFSTFLVSTLTNYLTERRHSRMVRGIFEHYLDSSVVENLIADPDKVRLGGERRECTVMFTDVADFTSTSETLSPEQVVQFMNIYLNAMTDIIIEEGGFVDKFIGDEIVAVFGAPNPLPDHAERACRAVLKMRQRVIDLQPSFREAGCQRDIFARTGLCTGEVVIGNMGSEKRMNYTAMGNTMNLGARIQGINKIYGTQVLVSQATASEAGNKFILREIDAVRVKGKQKAEHIFELLGFQEESSQYADRMRYYANALDAYRKQQWQTALDILDPLIQQKDGPSESLAVRCREYLVHAPPGDWDAVATMLVK